MSARYGASEPGRCSWSTSSSLTCSLPTSSSSMSRRLSWNELQTRDSEAAGDFYGGLFGWEIEPIEDDGRVVYTTIKNAGNQNGGLMPMVERHGDAPSFWL